MSSAEIRILERLEDRRLFATVIGLTADNMLVQFDDNNPSAVSSASFIKNLAAGERVVAIDYRPANSRLYGVVDGNGTDRIIRLDRAGNSSLVFNLTTQLDGAEFDADFNPVPDALRITSNTGQNLRVPFATGATNVDMPLNFNARDINGGTTPSVVASAYTNSFPGSTATVLYDVDSSLDSLAIQSPPNNGTLVTRGPLGVNANDMAGFDIRAADQRSSYRGNALVSINRTGDPGSRLYALDLATGGVIDRGAIGGTGAGAVTLRDISIVPARTPAPAASSLHTFSFSTRRIGASDFSSAFDTEHNRVSLDDLTATATAIV